MMIYPVRLSDNEDSFPILTNLFDVFLMKDTWRFQLFLPWGENQFLQQIFIVYFIDIFMVVLVVAVLRISD